MMLAGVDGCRGGWVCVLAVGPSFTAFVVPSVAELLARVVQPAVVAIDIPIGLPDKGSRDCDVRARSLLGQPRGSSVFPAPVRTALAGATFEEASRLHEAADGRRMTRQAFGTLPKVREVDDLMSKDPSRQEVVYEVHPEVSFAVWNGDQPMRHRKSKPVGRAEREALIDQYWPGLRDSLRRQLVSFEYKPDDLNDALAALWTAERIKQGIARRLPEEPDRDRFLLSMQMWA
jgi:predicted RNase H-like nuclease